LWRDEQKRCADRFASSRADPDSIVHEMPLSTAFVTSRHKPGLPFNVRSIRIIYQSYNQNCLYSRFKISYNMAMRRGHPTISFYLLALLTFIGLLTPPARGQGVIGPAATPVAVVRLQGKIDDFNRDTFFNHFKQAKAAGAKVIIVDLDTYGGLVTSGLDISRFLKSQNEVHTIAFVGDKAISAGAMIAMACDEIVIAPSAALGDCAPISIKDDGGLESMGDTEREKHESPIRAEFLDSAKRNHHDPLLAQAMVTMKIVVHWVQSPDGTRRFVDDKTFAELTKQGWTEVKDPDFGTPLDSATTLLTVSGTMATKLGLSSELQTDIGSLATHRNYNVIATYAPGTGDKIVEWLNNSYVRMVLIVLLIMSIYTSMHAPGHGFAEVLAMVSLGVLIGVPLLTGYAQWWEILVILLGMALLALELFVIPGFGITGLSGIVLIFFGLIMTFVGKEPAGTGVMPQLEGTWMNIRTGLAMVATALVSSLVLSMWFRRFLPKLPYFNRLILTTTTGNLDTPAVSSIPSVASSSFRPIVGALGEALNDLKPGGSATFYDSAIADVRVFSVISGAGYIPRGSKVVVLDNRDNRIIVRPEEAA
jgi:membrane-bound serine protease (ClpP class)